MDRNYKLHNLPHRAEIVLVRLPVEARYVGRLPVNWDRAFGYRGSARYIGAWWEPAGDEARYNDGIVAADGDWRVFQRLVDGPLIIGIWRALRSEGGRFALGSSEEPATHMLIVDRWGRRVFVLPKRAAQRFLEAQYAPSSRLTQSGLEQLWYNLQTPEDAKTLAHLVGELSKRVASQLRLPSEPCYFCPRHCQNGWIPIVHRYEKTGVFEFLLPSLFDRPPSARKQKLVRRWPQRVEIGSYRRCNTCGGTGYLTQNQLTAFALALDSHS